MFRLNQGCQRGNWGLWRMVLPSYSPDISSARFPSSLHPRLLQPRPCSPAFTVTPKGWLRLRAWASQAMVPAPGPRWLQGGLHQGLSWAAHAGRGVLCRGRWWRGGRGAVAGANGLWVRSAGSLIAARNRWGRLVQCQGAPTLQ